MVKDGQVRMLRRRMNQEKTLEASAVNRIGNPETFTAHYRGLANHYGFESGKIQPRSPEENGDVEQRHYRLKKAVDQALMLRGSRDFVNRQKYEQFLEQMFDQLNAGRQERLRKELKALGRLPARRHEDFREIECRVGVFGTICVLKNTYSLHSRLAGERVVKGGARVRHSEKSFARMRGHSRRWRPWGSRGSQEKGQGVYWSMEQWLDIRRRVLREGVSKRQILRETGMHWTTLEKILAQPSPPPGYQRRERPQKPKIDPYVDRIREILEQDQHIHRKQRHTAKRIWERLQEEGFLPLTHPPGEA